MKPVARELALLNNGGIFLKDLVVEPLIEAIDILVLLNHHILEISIRPEVSRAVHNDMPTAIGDELVGLGVNRTHSQLKTIALIVQLLIGIADKDIALVSEEVRRNDNVNGIDETTIEKVADAVHIILVIGERGDKQAVGVQVMLHHVGFDEVAHDSAISTLQSTSRSIPQPLDFFFFAILTDDLIDEF